MQNNEKGSRQTLKRAPVTLTCPDPHSARFLPLSSSFKVSELDSKEQTLLFPSLSLSLPLCSKNEKISVQGKHATHLFQDFASKLVTQIVCESNVKRSEQTVSENPKLNRQLITRTFRKLLFKYFSELQNEPQSSRTLILFLTSFFPRFLPLRHDWEVLEQELLGTSEGKGTIEHKNVVN